MLKVFASLVVCVILASGQTALANDVYRCGTTYQDTPCKNATSKPINAKPERKSITTSPSKTPAKCKFQLRPIQIANYAANRPKVSQICAILALVKKH